MKIEFASIPLVEVDVTLLVKITGPVNSDGDLPSAPPSTRRELETTPSVALSRLIDFCLDMY